MPQLQLQAPIYAVMLISKDFNIKGKFGPVGGKTYYSTTTFQTSSTDIADYATQVAPLNTFGGDEECVAYTEGESVTDGTISAYLINSSGIMLENDSSLSECSGQEKLLGVMKMSSELTISDATEGLKMIFTVTNNGIVLFPTEQVQISLLIQVHSALNFKLFSLKCHNTMV